MIRKKGLAGIAAFALTLCMVMSMSPVVTFASTDATSEQSASGNEENQEMQSNELVQASETVNDVKYVDTDGQEKTCSSATVVNKDMREAWNKGWYVVSGNVEIDEARISCVGDVKLILEDGCRLKITGEDALSASNISAGIRVTGNGNSFTVYGQKANSGKLIAKGALGCAGIGGGSGESGTNINIYGGNVEASSGSLGAGIGGGAHSYGENINIINSTVVAKGNDSGAGIGGGSYGKDIHIKHSNVTATALYNAAGIGGGDQGDGENISITDGSVVYAVSEHNSLDLIDNLNAAGIGGGDRGVGCNITISDSTVTAIGNKRGAGIGGGNERNGENITITNSTVKATGRFGGAGIGGGNHGKGKNITIENCPKVEAYGDQDGAGIGGGEDGDGEQITITNSHVTARGGDGDGGAGIGGGEDADSVGILIEGDDTVIDATGGKDGGAGIGGGKGRNGTNITIKDGEIRATGGEDGGSGIGGGNGGNAKGIVIEDGNVTANGKNGGAGIGGGKGGNITGLDINKHYNIDEFPLIIKGGRVWAYGGKDGAGIGGGAGGNRTSHIMICGGNVVAAGYMNSAGIGGGKGGEGWEIYIMGEDTQVHSMGGINGGAGIGGARDRTGANIHIGEGAKVTAKSCGDDPRPSGIGGGADGDTFSIYIYKESVTKADNHIPPRQVILNDGGDLSEYTHTMKYITVVPIGDEDPIDCMPGHNGSYEGFIATGTSAKSAGTITWNEVEGAEGYEVYYAKKGKSLKLAGTTTDLKFTKKGLNSKCIYRFKVKAFCCVDDQKEYIDTTPAIYVTGTKTRYSNATKVSAVPMAMQMETGDTGKLKVKVTKKSSKKKVYGKKIRYRSTDNYVASVSSKGKVKAKNEGIAYIYAYAASGAFAKIPVAVQ